MTSKLDKIINLSKRRGFIFQSSEQYGGIQGLYDYGPLGVEMKNNIKNIWWKDIVHMRDNIVGIDSSILLHKQVLHYSGHENTFSDPIVNCKKCKLNFRHDKLDGSEICSIDKTKHDFDEVKNFNLMFKTNCGTTMSENNTVYLRPETAQSIFINFKNVHNCVNKNLPFGIAQIGKSFRNEISPRNFIFRLCEFEQMELEFFVENGQDDFYHDYWINERYNWYIKYGINPENLVKFNQPKDELAHYSKATTDLLYKYFPEKTEDKQFDEIEGIANRTDYDLKCHTKNGELKLADGTVIKNKHSLDNLTCFDSKTNSHILPYCIEPSVGVDRLFLAFLMDSYNEEILPNNTTRIVLKLHHKISPYKIAVLPLKKNNNEIIAICKNIKQNLINNDFITIYDDSAAIGKLYRKQDEIGTPYCITVDFDSISNNTITVRNRDTMIQETININDIITYFNNKFIN